VETVSKARDRARARLALATALAVGGAMLGEAMPGNKRRVRKREGADLLEALAVGMCRAAE